MTCYIVVDRNSGFVVWTCPNFPHVRTAAEKLGRGLALVRQDDLQRVAEFDRAALGLGWLDVDGLRARQAEATDLGDEGRVLLERHLVDLHLDAQEAAYATPLPDALDDDLLRIVERQGVLASHAMPHGALRDLDGLGAGLDQPDEVGQDQRQQLLLEGSDLLLVGADLGTMQILELLDLLVLPRLLGVPAAGCCSELPEEPVDLSALGAQCWTCV